MTRSQRIKFFGTWNQCIKFLTTNGNHTKEECEEERQEMLKRAGAKPDKTGRYSANTLSNDGISTCLDFMGTVILGKPNKKRRSRTKIHAIQQLGLPDSLLNKLSADIFKTATWTDLTHEQLTKFQMTAKRLARTQKQND